MRNGYGVFNDEGLIEGPGLSKAEAEADAAKYRAEGDLHAKVAEICDDHEEHEAATCEECQLQTDEE
jgi:hypothetical protein